MGEEKGCWTKMEEENESSAALLPSCFAAPRRARPLLRGRTMRGRGSVLDDDGVSISALRHGVLSTRAARATQKQVDFFAGPFAPSTPPARSSCKAFATPVLLSVSSPSVGVSPCSITQPTILCLSPPPLILEDLICKPAPASASFATDPALSLPHSPL